MATDARDDGDVALRVLVVNDQPFQRRLIGKTLRAFGRVDIAYAANADQALASIGFLHPDLLIADWALPGGSGLALVKRVRMGEAGDAIRRVSIVMTGERARSSELARARDAGIDEYVLRPFSTASLLERATEALFNRRDFVESPNYVGPCRRRRSDEDYDGPRRRLFDTLDKRDDEPDVLIRKGLAGMYVKRIALLMDQADLSEQAALRELALTCGQLSVLASDMLDRLLMSAASSLYNYLKGVGAGGDINREVVQAHLDAIKQLAELPNYRADVRQQVAQELGVMVTKKLRQAGGAA